MSRHCSYLPYVLITPARNEEVFIEKTIRSVICQTVLPAKWVIVDDGSTDSTASIVEGYSSETDSFEGHNFVSGQCQLFRRRCFEEIGGYIPHKAGGIDWIAVSTSRMIGWKTQAFREKFFFHHRHSGTAERGILTASFLSGEKDYYLGGHPVWELFRIAYRMTKKPYLIGGIALGMGYLWALLCRIERPVSDQLMRFHRREQMLKLKAILKSILRLKRIDSFQVVPR